MTKRPVKPSKSPASLPVDYGPLLADIKARVQSARIKAGLAANRELLVLYWDIGRLILDRQQQQGWGTRVIDRLALDLQRSFPGQQDFSPRNLKYMRAFAEAWPETVIVHQPGAQIEKAGKHGPAIVQRSVAQLPWGHHTVLLNKLSTSEDRLWYATKAIEFGWSRNVLALQIDSGLHLRQGKAVSNFHKTLPPLQSDLAQQITKDPCVFDFLNMREAASERTVEDALMSHVEKFLLELGVGFALVGRQVHMEVGGPGFLFGPAVLPPEVALLRGRGPQGTRVHAGSGREDEFLPVSGGRPVPATGGPTIHWPHLVPQQQPSDCRICPA